MLQRGLVSSWSRTVSEIGYAAPMGGERLARAVGQDYTTAAPNTDEPFASELEALCTALNGLGTSKRDG